MKKIFEIKPENKDAMRAQVVEALAETRKDFEIYQEEYREKAMNALKKGEMPPTYAPSSTEIILSADLCCAVCGVKCGTMEYGHQKGIDNALADLQKYTTLCDEHSAPVE